MGALEVGDRAPEFRLPGIRMVDSVAVDGRFERDEYSLSDWRGRPVVLAFYPLDQSKVCTEQMCSYQDDFEGFAELGAEIWGISLQGVESHEEFALKNGLTFPLLADHRDGVGRSYGVALGGMLRRAIFIIDGDGIIRWKHVATVGFSYRKAAEIREQLLRLFPAPSGTAFAFAPPA
ncbi:MAG TPA: redoxin domain-containing protein [Pseudolysinimonas sp.]|nr:redoxin domain-containing protein [Pseudolysinimonas sp.]